MCTTKYQTLTVNSTDAFYCSVSLSDVVLATVTTYMILLTFQGIRYI